MSTPGISEIAVVQFGLHGSEDHVRRSVVNVVSYELFNGPRPVDGGVHDIRLGTIDHHYRCASCMHEKKPCPGHPGSLRLRAPVPQPIAINEIRRWLRIVCLSCGSPVVDMQKLEAFPASRRFAEAANMSTEGHKCRRCGAIHPKIVKDDEDYISFWETPPAARDAKKEGRKLYPSTAAKAFQRVSDATVEALGKSLDVHPRKLYLDVVQIPPVTIRPGVRNVGASHMSSSYNDVTNMLQHLVKRNGLLPEAMPETIERDSDLDKSLTTLEQIYYDLILGSGSTSVTQGGSGRRGILVGSKPAPALLRRLPRKKGRIRTDLLGARVFYISRTTISGNTRLRLDEVGIPLATARTLQVAETVQAYNIDRLMPFFLNGRRQYPGSTRVLKRATGDMHDVEGLRRDFLEPGDVLYRDVVDGDLAFYNRQPTLERSSIGVHRVKVLTDPNVHTFQHNVSTCENYNADFDGDQMNLWVPHGPMSQTEARYMSAMANWFISTKTSGPVNGEVQDAILGLFRLTRSAVRINKERAMWLLRATGLEPPSFGDAGPDRLFTGRELVSLILEKHAPINYSRPPSFFTEVYSPYVNYDPDEIHVEIEEGRLLRGVLDKKAVGAKAAGGLFHLVARSFGEQRALDLIFALQQLAVDFLDLEGFTVGTCDLVVTPEARTEIRKLVSGVLLESDLITQRLIQGKIVPPIGMTVREYYEQLQREALKIDDGARMRWILESINFNSNGLAQMVATGSKGSNPNILHIMANIGQIAINGERIGEQFGFRRTLAYFPRYALSPLAYGFVTNSYMNGMTSPEFIFADMNGRFDLINKALSTASTGYFMRKGVMGNQSTIVDNLRRCMKDTKIVQLVYGEDGVDPRNLELVKFRTILPALAKLREDFWLDAKAAGLAGTPAELETLQAAADAHFDAVVDDRTAFRHCFLRIENSDFSKPLPTELLMPVNVSRILRGVFITERRRASPSGRAQSPPSADTLLRRLARVADLCRRLPYCHLNDIQERKRAPVPGHLRAASFLMVMQVRAELAPPQLMKLSDAQLTFIIDSVLLGYSTALIEYGSTAGILAAQAIAEPLTQYMLDSHHRSVKEGTNKSGLIRVGEIYGARPVEEEKSPSMLLRVLPEFERDQARVQLVANSIEFMTLENVKQSHDILYEPYGRPIYPPFVQDKAWVEEFERNHPLLRPPTDLTHWCFRFVLDKQALVLKRVSLETIVVRLRAAHPAMFVVHTPESVPSVVIRMHLRSVQFRRGAEDEAKVREILERVLETPIRGVKGVLVAEVKKIVRHAVGPDDALVKAADLYAVKTVGTNIYGVLANTAVDPLSIVSSSIGDTCRLFGIEAARTKIIRETQTFMEDSAPNPRHLMVYAEEMTRLGYVSPLERAGLNAREHNNILLRMANAAPIQTLTEAALNCPISHVSGIAGPLMMGTVPRVGTLYNSVLVDEKFVRENTVSVDDILDSL